MEIEPSKQAREPLKNAALQDDIAARQQLPLVELDLSIWRVAATPAPAGRRRRNARPRTEAHLQRLQQKEARLEHRRMAKVGRAEERARRPRPGSLYRPGSPRQPLLQDAVNLAKERGIYAGPAGSVATNEQKTARLAAGTIYTTFEDAYDTDASQAALCNEANFFMAHRNSFPKGFNSRHLDLFLATYVEAMTFKPERRRNIAKVGII
ncbi:hypothetical protein D6C84_03765 [Aureobasidium pullulans]|uniref:Uncharacterized protein n=1 Tax=Aureobasidium pullulans TaxID=5580 RepID=A0A4S9XZM4_AURPU|nr:hypothetical protein D6C84_03765 [Aureobasidium pullulans]